MLVRIPPKQVLCVGQHDVCDPWVIRQSLGVHGFKEEA